MHVFDTDAHKVVFPLLPNFDVSTVIVVFVVFFAFGRVRDCLFVYSFGVLSDWRELWSLSENRLYNRQRKQKLGPFI